MSLVRSVENAALVGGHHVLYVDEGIFATCLLKFFQGLLYLFTDVQLLPLCVVDGVSHVGAFRLKEIHDGQDLAIVRD